MRLDSADPLESQVIGPFRGAIGRALTAVEYGCFPFETVVLREGKSELLELDGEVRLRFEGDHSVFLSWAQFPRWKDANSLAVSLGSFSKTGALEYINVNSLPVWAACLSHRLTSVDVLGWNDSPAIARLSFSKTSVLVGVGYEQGFGDADCVIVRPNDPMWLFSGTEAALLWSYSNADA